VEDLNLETIGDLVAKTEQELMACKNFGQASLDEIKNRLDAMGLKLSGK
jgi:DNA-directed RNA polymerase subunit alpha